MAIENDHVDLGLIAEFEWLSLILKVPVSVWLIAAVIIGGVAWWKTHFYRYEERRSQAIAAATPDWATFSRRLPDDVKRLANRFRLIKDCREGWSGMNLTQQRLTRHHDLRPNRIIALDYQYRITDADTDGYSVRHFRQNLILIETAEDWPEIFIKPIFKPIFGAARDPKPILETDRYELHVKPGHLVDKKLAGVILRLLETSSLHFRLETLSDAILISVSKDRSFFRNDGRLEPSEMIGLLDLAVQFDQLGKTYLIKEVIDAQVVEPLNQPTNPGPPIK
jgi:hypothetical protein